jgi:para-nitrobenzyl esterase
MSHNIFDTKNGTVQGRDMGAVTRICRLRYALAPVGALRFAPPEPVSPWRSVLDCTGPDAPVAPQLPSRLAKVMGDYPAAQNEDCLHLDIWVPHARGGALPVLVFIHGGAFMTGGGAMSCYDGAALAEREEIIVVNISYRLGVLGFLPITGVAPANLGLRDIELALQVIRAQISGFGGDVGNITVCGQSAGAYAIQALLTRDVAPNLFDRAILMSSPMGLRSPGPDAQAPAAAQFCQAIGMQDADGLRAAPVADILNAQGVVLRGLKRGPDEVAPPFLPVLDGEFLCMDPTSDKAALKAAWCPMIAGVTREEHAAFHYLDAAFHAQASALIETRFTAAYGTQGATELVRARARRVPATDSAVLIDHGSRQRFVRGTFDYLDARSNSAAPTWAYVFAWQSPTPGIGACHCIELPFVFGNLPMWHGAPMLGDAPEAELEGLAHLFGGALAQFAHSGDPAPQHALHWPNFGTDRVYLTVGSSVNAAALLPGTYPC